MKMLITYNENLCPLQCKHHKPEVLKYCGCCGLKMAQYLLDQHGNGSHHTTGCVCVSVCLNGSS